jgi:hypothetical protein
MTWDEYCWPEWIPEEVREQIRSFWNPEWGRGPKAWQENNVASYNRHPPLGALVTCESIGGRKTFTGRWVPAWNNMGRVVLKDGSVEVSSTCALQVIPQGYGASLRGFPVNG